MTYSAILSVEESEDFDLESFIASFANGWVSPRFGHVNTGEGLGPVVRKISYDDSQDQQSIAQLKEEISELQSLDMAEVEKACADFYQKNHELTKKWTTEKNVTLKRLHVMRLEVSRWAAPHALLHLQKRMVEILDERIEFHNFDFTEKERLLPGDWLEKEIEDLKRQISSIENRVTLAKAQYHERNQMVAALVDVLGDAFPVTDDPPYPILTPASLTP